MSLEAWEPDTRTDCIAMNAYIRILFVLLAASAMMFALSAGSSPFERAIGVCIRNCAQCKKMFGPYFLGQKCADSCVKYKGKLIPDCEDEGSIQPFLQALDSDY